MVVRQMADDVIGDSAADAFESPAWRSHSLFRVISRQNACLCVFNVKRLTNDLLSFITATNNQGSAQNCVDDVLLQCSLLEKLFIVHVRQIHAGRMCSSVKNILDVIILYRADFKDFLLKCLASENQFVAYAASQTLFRFFGSLKEGAAMPTAFFVEMDVYFASKLSECNLSEAGSILSIIHRTCQKSAEKLSPPSESIECCTPVAVKRTAEPETGTCWKLSISQAIPSLVTATTAADEMAKSPETVICLSEMLQIMLFSAHTDGQLQDILSRVLPKLLLLLDTCASLAMTAADILHKIFSRFKASDDSRFKSSMETALCIKVLTILPILLQKLPAYKRSNLLRGFGGTFTFTERNPTWSYGEFQSGGRLEAQRIVLLHLSALRLLAMSSSPHSDEQQSLIVQSVRCLQSHCAANSSLTWHCSPVILCSEYLASLFGDQDDALIEALEHCLEIRSDLARNAPGIDHDVIGTMWNPHSEFYFFLLGVGLDHVVLLDLLMANDTSFLSYFVRYLKLASADADGMFATHLELSQHLSMDATTVEGRRNVAKAKQPKTDVELHGNLVGYDYSSEEDVLEVSTSSSQPLVVHISHDVDASSRREMPLSLVRLIGICSSLCLCVEKQLRSNLFPYNAKPLVKLLKAFDSCYKQ